MKPTPFCDNCSGETRHLQYCYFYVRPKEWIGQDIYKGDPAATLKELADLAKQTSSPKEKKKHQVLKLLNDGQKFSAHFKLKTGHHQVPAAIIYDCYKMLFDKPLAKNKFFYEFSQLFTPQRLTRNRYYLLNLEGHEMIYKILEDVGYYAKDKEKKGPGAS